MNEPEEPREAFWDLLADISRLQAQMGRDLIAWSQVNEAGGRALQGNAETLRLMSDVGRRSERFFREGPSSAVRQAMQFFTNPLQTFGAPGDTVGDPLTRFWDAWTPPGRGRPPRGGEGAGEGEVGSAC